MIFSGFTGIMRYAVPCVPVDNKVTMVLLGSPDLSGAQSFGGAHRGRIYVRVFIGKPVFSLTAKRQWCFLESLDLPMVLSGISRSIRCSVLRRYSQRLDLGTYVHRDECAYVF
jgi:hypothetical protein